MGCLPRFPPPCTWSGAGYGQGVRGCGCAFERPRVAARLRGAHRPWSARALLGASLGQDPRLHGRAITGGIRRHGRTVVELPGSDGPPSTGPVFPGRSVCASNIGGEAFSYLGVLIPALLLYAAVRRVRFARRRLLVGLPCRARRSVARCQLPRGLRSDRSAGRLAPSLFFCVPLDPRPGAIQPLRCGGGPGRRRGRPEPPAGSGTQTGVAVVPCRPVGHGRHGRPRRAQPRGSAARDARMLRCDPPAQSSSGPPRDPPAQL